MKGGIGVSRERVEWFKGFRNGTGQWSAGFVCSFQCPVGGVEA